MRRNRSFSTCSLILTHIKRDLCSSSVQRSSQFIVKSSMNYSISISLKSILHLSSFGQLGSLYFPALPIDRSILQKPFNLSCALPEFQIPRILYDNPRSPFMRLDTGIPNPKFPSRRKQNTQLHNIRLIHKILNRNHHDLISTFDVLHKHLQRSKQKRFHNSTTFQDTILLNFIRDQIVKMEVAKFTPCFPRCCRLRSTTYRTGNLEAAQSFNYVDLMAKTFELQDFFATGERAHRK